MKGGYKIIDFKNVSLSGTPVTMTDVLVDLLNNYEKVVLLSHVVLSGSAKDDCFSTVLSDGAGGVKLNCYDGYISINSSGAVTYTVASASGMAENIAELTAEIGDLDDLETTEKGSAVAAINEVNSALIKYVDINVNAGDTWVNVPLPREISGDRIINVTSRAGTNFNGCIWWKNKTQNLITFLRINTADTSLTVLKTVEEVTIRIFYY